MKYILIILLAAGITGCKDKKPAPATTKKPSPPRNTIIDAVTGRTAVEAGKKAKATLEQVQKKREEDFGELVAP